MSKYTNDILAALRECSGDADGRGACGADNGDGGLDLYGVIDVLMSGRDERLPPVPRSIVNDTLLRLHTLKLIHILRRVRVGGRGSRGRCVWAYGPGKDAGPLRKLSGAQRSKRHRDKLREEDPIEYRARALKKNMRESVRVAKADVAAAWFMVDSS